MAEGTRSLDADSFEADALLPEAQPRPASPFVGRLSVLVPLAFFGAIVLLGSWGGFIRGALRSSDVQRPLQLSSQEQESCQVIGCSKSSYEASRSCQCNDACDDYNDCCWDYQATCFHAAGSCAEYGCGEEDQTGSCECNSGCFERGSCCIDYMDHCSAPAFEGDGKHTKWNSATKDAYIVDTFANDTSFFWGSAIAAYQSEGSAAKGGRSPSIWDVFSHENGRTWRGETGDIADDFYNRYESDLELLQSYGFNSFRFSISWSRVLPMSPDGERYPNPEGIAFYKNLTARLLQMNIRPFVTMYHWDLPADLDWLDNRVVDEFIRYADFLWMTFPEIDNWITFNEPWSFCYLGYKVGTMAPGVSQAKHLDKAYTCGHHVLLAHGRAVQLFKQRYATERSQIGITLNFDYAFPLNPDNPNDVKAAEINIEVNFGWFAGPVYHGDYPDILKQYLKQSLPEFTEQEKEMLKGSYIGFFGLNTYSGHFVYAKDDIPWNFQTTFKDETGKLIGPWTIHAWLYKVPKAIYKLLEYVNDHYKPETIIITENGCNDPHVSQWTPASEVIHDNFRIGFYRDYIAWVAAAKNEGIPVAGYFAWSLLDNFEWGDGYKRRFGLTYVDYNTLQRYPKDSSRWFKNIIDAMAPEPMSLSS